MIIYLITFIVSTIAGFGTGLLGIGGGLVIYPVFLFLVPLLGLETLSINEVSGIATIQIVTGSLFAYLSHRKNIIKIEHLYLIAVIAAIGALTGGITSSLFPEKLLLILYLFILTTSFCSMTFFKESKIQSNLPAQRNIIYILCLITGFLAGSLGLGGAILYIPILRYFYGLTTKLAISITTFIVFTGAIMTCTGKMVTGQIPYDLIIFTLVGSFIGAKAGACISKKTDSNKLRYILLALIFITIVRVLIAVIY